MTPIQVKILYLLAGCTFVPGAFTKHKRFVRAMVSLHQTYPRALLSQKQNDFLVGLFHHYRKQIHQYEEVCLELNPDAFSLTIDLHGNMTVNPVTKKGAKIELPKFQL